jgi:pyruvate kinase
MKRYRAKTGVISTLGPASSDESTLRKMVTAGMDIARINFSHGTYTQYLNYIENINKINKKYRRRIKIMGDLEGPRIRIGKFRKNATIKLEKHKTVYMAKQETGNSETIPLDYSGSFSDFKSCQYIYIDDGNIVIKVEYAGKERIKGKVVSGGELKERKGVNAPGAELQFPALMEKDAKDIDFLTAHDFDYIALSFVRTSRDVKKVKEKIKNAGRTIPVIAKIENRQGIDNLKNIMKIADGIMVARGDLGISIKVYKVPFVQKEIIKQCRERKRISITATQMLESMTENPFPTRAEVSDVANAVIDGSNYLMLSAETAVGKYPVEAVAMMNKIIKYTEMNM